MQTNETQHTRGPLIVDPIHSPARPGSPARSRWMLIHEPDPTQDGTVVAEVYSSAADANLYAAAPDTLAERDLLRAAVAAAIAALEPGPGRSAANQVLDARRLLRAATTPAEG